MRADPAPTWYLFDYGMVISDAPEAADWVRLREAVGTDLEPPTSPYWTNRLAFDAGRLDPATYWSRAAGRPLEDDLVAELEALDAAQWSHLNPATSRVLDHLHEQGARLALLSNMPPELSRRLSDAAWLAPFAHLFFSGLIGLVKPDPRVYRHVLAGLGVTPDRVVFVDDSPANIAAADELGLRTVLHTPRTDLAAELGLRPHAPT